jgi:hypothetical protein
MISDGYDNLDPGFMKSMKEIGLFSEIDIEYMNEKGENKLKDYNAIEQSK